LIGHGRQKRSVYLYDVSDPCKAKPVGPAMLSNAETGTYMVGVLNRRIYVNAGGLMEYKLSDPPESCHLGWEALANFPSTKI
jgi:hypothetical protein